MSDLPRVHHGSLLIFLACGINGESLGSYLYTRLGHEHGSLAYSWNSKKLQPRHSSWHSVEWRNFHNLPVLFFPYVYGMSLSCMHTEWRHATPTSHHSFDLHICIGSSEMGKQGVIFVSLSWLIQLWDREDTGSPAWRSSAKKFWWVAAGWYHYNSSHMPAMAVYLWFRYTRLLMMPMDSDFPS